MKFRRTSWLAVLLLTISMIGLVLSLALSVANSSLLDVLQSEFVFYGLAFCAAALVGSMLAIHRPSNPIGWIFLVASIAQVSQSLADRYPTYVARHEGGTTSELTALLWLGNWIWIIAFFVPFTFIFLLFPTGRLPSGRWRAFAWIGASQLLLMVLSTILIPGPLEDTTWPGDISNPTGVGALKAPAEFAFAIAFALVYLFMAGSVASLIVRLRSTSTQERQQLKWLAYAASIPIAGFVISTVEAEAFSTDIGWIILVLGIVAQPIAIGIAILKHNLYDIDRLINRTLVYGSLTLLLVLGFAGNILLFQIILTPFTGGNDLAVAGSTLLVFALFRPVRDRLQQFVDSRFYRKKYDAQQTLTSFGIKSRDALDIDQLASELTAVVATTMQPEHVWVWLRPMSTGKERAGKRARPLG